MISPKFKVKIIDVGNGNISSVVRMAERAGAEVAVLSSPLGLVAGDTVLLPGVGSFDYGVARLSEAGLTDFLLDWSLRGESLIGICLGMQLLSRSSEEGRMKGIGALSGVCQRLVPHDAYRAKVPHTGWNSLVVRNETPINISEFDTCRMYFSHSYRYVSTDQTESLAHTVHGVPIPAVVSVRRTVGLQFHPEKSHQQGQRLFEKLLSELTRL